MRHESSDFINLVKHRSGAYYQVMNKNLALVGLIVALALAVGFIIGTKDTDNDKSRSNEVTEPSKKSENTETDSDNDVKSLVTYTLPNGWEESNCDPSSGSVYFIPSGESEVDCSENPELQISLSSTNKNITECSQIQDVEEVKKHICKSEFINDLRSLVAETEYLESSTYGRETFVKTYYLDSGSGIVKAMHVSAANSSSLSAFDELVNSILAK